MPSAHDRQPGKRWQFSVRALLLLPVCSALLIFGVLHLLEMSPLGAYRISGPRRVTDQFLVIDAATSAPVSQAVVCVYQGDSPEKTILHRGETSAAGEVCFT